MAGLVGHGSGRDARDIGIECPGVRAGLASYTLVNLSASYQLTNHVQLFARIEHLFNDHYEEVFTFGTPGRAAYGGVRICF